MGMYFRALAHTFDFTGRDTRPQFWWFAVISVLICVIVAFIGDYLTGDGREIFEVMLAFHLIPTLSAEVRRLRDAGRNGWLILIQVIPLIGTIIMISLLSGASKDPVADFEGSVVRRGQRLEPGFGEATAAPVEALEKLAALRTSGAIGEEEFKAMKARLLR